MYKIKISGGSATRTSWDSDKRAYVTEPIESLIPYLECPIELENTTFGQFFSFIARDKEFYERAFRSATYGFPITPLVEEIKKPVKLGPREWSPRADHPHNPLNLDYVEVFWGVDMEDGMISDYPGFHGWGDWDSPHHPGHKGGIAVEYSETNMYRDVILKFDHQYVIYDEKLNPVFTTKKVFRVQDPIRAILFELTWAGDITNGREAPFKHK